MSEPLSDAEIAESYYLQLNSELQVNFALSNRIVLLEAALREAEWDRSLSSLLNEYQMVDDVWPEGVEPVWRRFCSWGCGGDNIHGHQPGCRISALLSPLSERPEP